MMAEISSFGVMKRRQSMLLIGFRMTDFSFSFTVVRQSIGPLIVAVSDAVRNGCLEARWHSIQRY